jgi:ribosomal protein S17
MKKSRTDEVLAMKKRGCVCVVLKADKGDAIVILREEQYTRPIYRRKTISTQ